MTSPTQRSIKMLKEDGWAVAIVERWNPYARIRQDLFGFADLVAIKEDQPAMFVQTTSGSNLAARRHKILENKEAHIALKAGIVIEIHGWRKVKVRRGGKATRWEAKIERMEGT